MLNRSITVRPPEKHFLLQSYGHFDSFRVFRKFVGQRKMKLPIAPSELSEWPRSSKQLQSLSISSSVPTSDASVDRHQSGSWSVCPPVIRYQYANLVPPAFLYIPACQRQSVSLPFYATMSLLSSMPLLLRWTFCLSGLWFISSFFFLRNNPEPDCHGGFSACL